MTTASSDFSVTPFSPDSPLENFPLPLLGFCAYSGTGKTTTLKKLIPLLREQGVRLAVIKHAHHDFEIDYPGKDSYELRHAGAEQLIVASASRIAQVTEVANPGDDPDLADLLSRLRTEELNLVLVEGFKDIAFPKIELHRSGFDRPYIFNTDPNVIAVAVDQPIPAEYGDTPPQLDLNDPSRLVTFIIGFMQQATAA